ncbi:MAG: alcohol dehydrogenase catalytic domain-containing protein [Firmicutes bacterium]|nr:alcohol dehydrogenase catalytic domain-containing protein [Alicyclobacillaceae bacterium]MCL6496014.1 alcohol dehydrogenase catalytic domain-containing protein [Bacillota bacterium]
MKAAVLTEDGGLGVTTLPDPAPRPGEVVVAVAACGVCGSDVHRVERRLGPPGMVLGHEFGGEVVEVGADVTGLKVGDRVAVNPVAGCGQCETCRRGIPFACRARPNIGINAPGAYAEYVAVPADQCLVLPEGMDARRGAFLEPLAVALQAVHLSGDVRGADTLVFGTGSIGLNLVLALRARGAGRIVAIGRSPARRAMAERLGATWVIDSRQDSVPEVFQTRDYRFWAAYECSAAPDAIDTLIEAVETGGTVVEVALAERQPVNLLGLVAKGVHLVGSCAFDGPTYRESYDLVFRQGVDPEPLVTERVGLDELPAAMARLLGPNPPVKVMVEPGRRS